MTNVIHANLLLCAATAREAVTEYIRCPPLLQWLRGPAKEVKHHKESLLKSCEHINECICGFQSMLTISKTDSCLTFWMLSRPCAF